MLTVAMFVEVVVVHTAITGRDTRSEVRKYTRLRSGIAWLLVCVLVLFCFVL